MTENQAPTDGATNGAVLTDEMVEPKSRPCFLATRPSRRSRCRPCTLSNNKHLRHVPLAAVVEIAQLLELAPSQVQDTLTFYGFFKQDAPHGKVRAWVCRSISCSLRGGEEVLEHMCEKLNIQPGQTTPDGRFTVEPAECLGACEFAPCMLAGDDLHKDLTNDKADAFIDSVK